MIKFHNYFPRPLKSVVEEAPILAPMQTLMKAWSIANGSTTSLLSTREGTTSQRILPTTNYYIEIPSPCCCLSCGACCLSCDIGWGSLFCYGFCDTILCILGYIARSSRISQYSALRKGIRLVFGWPLSSKGHSLVSNTDCSTCPLYPLFLRNLHQGQNTYHFDYSC